MNRHDLLLQQMGLTQWQLRRPELLKGAVNIAVGSQIRLIVIGEEQQKNQEFVQDLLRSAELTNDDYLWVSEEQAQHLSVPQPCHYWIFSTTQNHEKNDRTFPFLAQSLSQWQTDLAELRHNSSQKRAFWSHIQQHLLKDA